MNRRLLIVLSLLVAVLMSITAFAGCGSNESDSNTSGEGTIYADSIMVYSGAGMRKPMDEIGQLFKDRYGTQVNYNYAGSNALLSQMELTQEGDVYMPGELYYMEVARDKGFIDEEEIVAYHIPVITVPVDNPAGVQTLEDLAKPGLTLVWGDPQAAAIGRKGNDILEKNGLKDAVWANIVATVPTMNELIVYISEKQADATINWGDVVQDVEKILIVDIPRDQNIIDVVPVGSLTFSENRETAEAFVEFCVSEEAQEIFEKYGFPAYPNPEYGE